MSQYVGSGLSALGNVAPGFLGGGPTGWMGAAGNYLTGSGAPAGGGDYTGVNLPTNFGDVTGAGDSAGGAIGPYGPAPTLGTDPTTAGSSAGGTAPFAGPPSPVAANWYTDPGSTGVGTAGGVSSVPFTDPAASTPDSPGFWHSLFFGSPADATGAGGTAGAGWPGIFSAKGLTGIAGGTTDLLKYLQQRSLLDPSNLASQSQQLVKARAAALRKAIFPQLTAQAQETGQINAPYLMNQAYTTAIAPVMAQIQEAALTDWLRANQLAGGLYPDTGALGGFVSPDVFGGGKSEST